MRALANDATYYQSKHIKMSVFHQQKLDLTVEGRETNSSSSSLAEVFAFLKLLVKLVSSSILKYQINPFLVLTFRLETNLPYRWRGIRCIEEQIVLEGGDGFKEYDKAMNIVSVD